MLLSCSIFSAFLVIYSKNGISQINSHQQTYFLACKNLDISVCYHLLLEQKEIHSFSIPTRNKCTSTYKHKPADETTNAERVGTAHTAFDLTPAQKLSSIPGKSPVTSSRENVSVYSCRPVHTDVHKPETTGPSHFVLSSAGEPSRR